jgi:hypothetical protein
MGLIGIKVWIYKGEVLTAVKRDAKVADERNSRVRENFQPRRPRGDRGGRDGDDDKQFAPQGDRPPRDNNFRRPRGEGQQGGENRGERRDRGERSGGFNRGGRDRAPAAPPANYGNRKTGIPRSQPRPKPAEPVNENAEAVNNAAEQAEGGNGDVNA